MNPAHSTISAASVTHNPARDPQKEKWKALEAGLRMIYGLMDEERLQIIHAEKKNGSKHIRIALPRGDNWPPALRQALRQAGGEGAHLIASEPVYWGYKKQGAEPCYRLDALEYTLPLAQVEAFQQALVDFIQEKAKSSKAQQAKLARLWPEAEPARGAV